MMKKLLLLFISMLSVFVVSNAMKRPAFPTLDERDFKRLRLDNLDGIEDDGQDWSIETQNPLSDSGEEVDDSVDAWANDQVMPDCDSRINYSFLEAVETNKVHVVRAIVCDEQFLSLISTYELELAVECVKNIAIKKLLERACEKRMCEIFRKLHLHV